MLSLVHIYDWLETLVFSENRRPRVTDPFTDLGLVGRKRAAMDVIILGATTPRVYL